MSLDDLTPARNRATSIGAPPGSPSADGHRRGEAHMVTAVGNPSTPTKLDPGPMSRPSGSSLPVDGQMATAPHRILAVGISSPPAMIDATSTRRPPGVNPSDPPVQHRGEAQPAHDGWIELRIWAEMFHDAQQQRIATTNRAERGGVDPDLYVAYIDATETAEKAARRGMILAYRRTVPEPIRAWVKGTHGLGEPLMARLLGHLGHPRWATPHHWEGTGAARVLITDPPFERTVSQLWQFCGHGRPGRARKGASAEELAAMGSPNLKMIVHLAAECCVKQTASPFRLVYEQARLDYADKVHSVECVRCGPSGKPAQPGDPWNLGHQHGAALRKVGKEILRDLWKVAA